MAMFGKKKAVGRKIEDPQLETVTAEFEVEIPVEGLNGLVDEVTLYRIEFEYMHYIGMMQDAELAAQGLTFTSCCDAFAAIPANSRLVVKPFRALRVAGRYFPANDEIKVQKPKVAQ